jgi:hypothetical protein
MRKTNRFALLAVLGAVLGSALIMGCGGGAEETRLLQQHSRRWRRRR